MTDRKLALKYHDILVKSYNAKLFGYRKWKYELTWKQCLSGAVSHNNNETLYIHKCDRQTKKNETKIWETVTGWPNEDDKERK